jgi:LCP family protein required for cell wall assembly
MAAMDWLFDTALGLSLLAFTGAAVSGAVFAEITGSRSLKAATWSAILPGAGQWYAGARIRAAQFLAIDFALVVLAMLAVQNKTAILVAWFTPRDLVLMMIGSVALLVFRMWSAYDAHVLIADFDRPRRQRQLRALTVLAISGVLLAPHAVFGYYDVTQYNLLTDESVFRSDDPVVAAPPPTTSAVTEPTAAPQPGDPPAASTTVTPPPTRPPIWDGFERLNILVLGADDTESRSGIRTDTMIVISLDPETGDAAMFSIPRNYAEAPHADSQGKWDCQCFPDLLNGLYQAGLWYDESFPGPGTGAENAIKFGISEILGIPIHYYAMLNLEGFAGVIDALGGVEINVPNTIIEPKYGGPGMTGRVEIPAGTQTLDGYTALAYSRIRSQSSDYARMNRQRCVIKAVLDQSDPLELLAVYPQIAEVLRDWLRTDIPLSRLRDFIELLPKFNAGDVVALSFTPANGYQDGRTEYGNKYDAGLISEHVALILAGQPLPGEDGPSTPQSLDDACS